MDRRIPARDERYKYIKGSVDSGWSSLRAGPNATACMVAKARAEIFGRIKPVALLAMLIGEGGVKLDDEPEESIYRGQTLLGSARAGGGGAGAMPTLPLLSVTVAASAVGIGSSPVRHAAAALSGSEASSDILILDVRSSDVADIVAALRITGALHVPASSYLTQDRLPHAVHAARRATPQPVVVVYDETGAMGGDASQVAEKLCAVGKFDAAVVLVGGLRGAALYAPALLEGAMAHDFIAGVNNECHVGNVPRASRHGRGATRDGGYGGGGSGESVTGSLASAMTRTSVLTSFGASKRF